MKKITKLSSTVIGATLLASASTVFAGNDGMYAVTITNLTRGISFTPIMVATHKKGHPVFSLGQPASSELATIAESGNSGPLQTSINPYDAASSEGLLAPGASVTINVNMSEKNDYVSVASMLLPTNDGFVAINGVKGPGEKGSMMVMSPAYDAGSETNSELCSDIPGPTCGGNAISVEDGEGFVHIHAGIHGIGDLTAADYDWRNPAAKITIKRMK
jgi:hypothetical protein